MARMKTRTLAIPLPSAHAGLARRFAVAMAVLHLALFAGFVWSLASAAQALSADAPSCAGADLLAMLEADRPAEVAALRAEAAGVLHGKGLFWKVVSPEGAVSHVFGTMHSPDPRVTALDPAVEAALAESRAVLVENVDALDPAKMGAQIAALRDMVFLKDRTLEDMLPAETVEKLQPAVEARGMPWLAARQMQPWMLAAAVARAQCDTQAAAAGLPVLDAILANRAQEGGRELAGLETVAEQFEAIAGVSEEFHVSALADLTSMLDSAEDMMETTKRLYLSGETALLLPLMRLLSPKAYEGEGYAQFQHLVVARRNANMAERAVAQLRKGGVFMAVGALHLPGEDGVLALLEKQGFAVSAAGGV